MATGGGAKPRTIVALACLLALAVSASGCGTMLGMSIGSVIDRHNLETLVPADSVGLLAPGTRLHLRTTLGDPVRGTLEQVVNAGGRPQALRLTIAEARAGGHGITEEIQPRESHTIAIADISTIRVRKPGAGQTWIYMVVGGAIDLVVIDAIANAGR